MTVGRNLLRASGLQSRNDLVHIVTDHAKPGVTSVLLNNCKEKGCHRQGLEFAWDDECNELMMKVVRRRSLTSS